MMLRRGDAEVLESSGDAVGGAVAIRFSGV